MEREIWTRSDCARARNSSLLTLPLSLLTTCRISLENLLVSDWMLYFLPVSELFVHYFISFQVENRRSDKKMKVRTWRAKPGYKTVKIMLKLKFLPSQTVGSDSWSASRRKRIRNQGKQKNMWPDSFLSRNRTISPSVNASIRRNAN